MRRRSSASTRDRMERPGEPRPDATTYHGHEGVKRFWEMWAEAISGMALEIEECRWLGRIGSSPSPGRTELERAAALQSHPSVSHRSPSSGKSVS
jgi:hypothetical protein